CNEYWRQEPTGEVLIGGHAAADKGMGIGTYSMTSQRDIAPRLARLLARFHPALRDARVVRVWAGLLDFASLEVPMAGASPPSDARPCDTAARQIRAHPWPGPTSSRAGSRPPATRRGALRPAATRRAGSAPPPRRAPDGRDR